MAQQNRRRKKKPLGFKYILRRVLLVILLLGFVGIAGWYVGKQTNKTTPLPEPEPPSSQPEQSSQSSQPVPQPEPHSQPEEQTVSSADWRLLLVNTTTPLPDDYAPELIIVADSYKVDARIADSVKRMFAQAKEDGINLMICSAYRSPEYQEGLFSTHKEQELATGKNEEEAIAATASLIMPPGLSEHHTGLALDIVTPDYQTLDDGFADTSAFQWLDKNAASFGFILRYPADKQSITKISYEPWHYRYVGEEHAQRIKEKGYCLEEYLYASLQSSAQTPKDESTDGTEEPSSEPGE